MLGKGKKFLAAGAGLVLSGFVGITAYAAVDLLMKVGMDRKEPRFLKGLEEQISGARGGPAYAAALREAQQRQEKRITEPVTVTARDGTPLTGHWVPAEQPKRVLLALHGWRGGWTQAFGMMADFLEEAGCSVLYVDQRGTGDSGGDYIGFGLTEKTDCADWLWWLSSRCRGLPLYMIGMSMGASAALMAAGETLPENLRGIIADSAYTTPKAVLEHVSRSNLRLPRSLERRGEAIFQKKLGLPPDAVSTVDTLKNCHIPVLLIHGGKDRFVPVDMVYQNYRACAGPRRLLVIPEADHVGSWFTDPERYRKMLLEFWGEWDG